MMNRSILALVLSLYTCVAAFSVRAGALEKYQIPSARKRAQQQELFQRNRYELILQKAEGLSEAERETLKTRLEDRREQARRAGNRVDYRYYSDLVSEWNRRFSTDRR